MTARSDPKPEVSTRKAPGMGIAEIAEFCAVSKPNVRKMLVRYAVRPWFVVGGGSTPVYRREAVEAMQRERMANKVARAADEKRRLASRAA